MEIIEHIQLFIPWGHIDLLSEDLDFTKSFSHYLERQDYLSLLEYGLD